MRNVWPKLFHVHFMERRGRNTHWQDWLQAAFAKNRSWDVMTRQILRADFRDETNRGAAYFFSRRLEKSGQNPTDYPGLTRDVGRRLDKEGKYANNSSPIYLFSI